MQEEIGCRVGTLPEPSSARHSSGGFSKTWVEHSDDAKLCGADRPLTKKVCTAISLAACPAVQRHGCGRRIAAAMSTPSFSAYGPMLMSCAARGAQVFRAFEQHGVQPRTACC